MEDIDIVDVHVHPGTRERIANGGEYLEHAAEYFGTELREIPLEETVAEFRDAGVETAVLFALDHETNTGNPAITNDWVAEQRDRFDLFRAFASVDPHKGELARREAVRAIEDLGLDGFKFQQAIQGFYPDDDAFDPLWDTLEDLGKPVLFHGGTTGLGAGAPGGDGIHLKYTKPIPHIDDVAADHPSLPIIIAHPAWPWHTEQLAVAQQKGNVYIDLSGWRPKYIPEEVKQYARTRLQDKVLFGSDYPLVGPDEWLADFADWGFPPDVEAKILSGNARKLLDL